MKQTIVRSTCGTYAGYCSHRYHKEEQCEPCRDAMRVHCREYSAKNREKINSYQNNRRRERWATDESFRKQVTENRKKNIENVRRISREYNRRNKEKLQQYEKWYRENFPEKGRERQRKRRAMKYQNGYEPYTEAQVLALYGTNCHICNNPIDLTAPSSTSKTGWEQGLHIDHVIPIANGGPDTIDNVRPAHGFCNISKGAKMTEEFEQEIDPSLFEDDETIDLEDYDDHAFDEDELEEWEEEDDEYEEE